MKHISLRRVSGSEELRRYLLAFLLGFGSLLIVLLPIIIKDGGYFIYYGDYNSQQIPFYSLANDAVRSGSFGWNWYTDLGVNFIGSYSFYLLGSPFFWLSTILPRSWVTFSMPILLCMKHGVASLTAYAYIRRFVRNSGAALIGGMLYAFSGFQIFNLFFNHFQDVTAFFPLMLIAMEECVNNNRRGVFALSVALMAIINYFFFTGQVVFLVLYFIVRCFSKDFHATVKNFFVLLFEAVVGVMISCIILLPAVYTVWTNTRVSSYLYGMDMVAYSDRTRIWRIIYSMFMIPDVPARPNLFSSDYAKWASIGGYLPLFSMAGVISFLKHKDGHWAKRLTIICAVCACIPILNSAFYMFNSSYYARWYYMPVLILAMMTAYALDNREMNWKLGFGISIGMMAAFGIISFLPKKSDGEVVWNEFANYPSHFYIVLTVCAVSLLLTIYLLHRREKRKRFMRLTTVSVVLASIVCSMTVVYFGAFEQERALTYVDQAIDEEGEISVSLSEDDFFRIDVSESCDNYPMFWQLPSIRCFHSVVPSSIMTFYETLGVTRNVATRPELSYYTLRGLLSVRYYYNKSTTTKEIDLPGFTYETTENGFDRYVNEYYVPMGFTYDSYITETTYSNIEKDNRSNVLIRALVLSASQVAKYGSYMNELTEEELTLTEEEYLTECTERAANSCDTFTYDSSGFTATITLENDNLVFFSVPYEDGWSATVNGKKVTVEEVDEGLIAVAAKAGANTIVFTYETPGLKIGIWLTLGGIVLLVVYLILYKKFIRPVPGRRNPSTVDYESSADPYFLLDKSVAAELDETEKSAKEESAQQEKPSQNQSKNKRKKKR